MDVTKDVDNAMKPDRGASVPRELLLHQITVTPEASLNDPPATSLPPRYSDLEPPVSPPPFGDRHMSQSPQPQSRTQVEFGAEENRTFRELARSMSGVSLLLKVIGFAFLVFLGLLIYRAIQKPEGYAIAVAVAAAIPTFVFLILGFQTSSAARSFLRIAETESRDVWHLMNALQSLTSMYKLLWFAIIAGLVLLGIAIVMYFAGAFSSSP
jgi:hypothetical protein